MPLALSRARTLDGLRQEQQARLLGRLRLSFSPECLSQHGFVTQQYVTIWQTEGNRRRLKFIKVIEQALLLQRLLYLPGVDALLQLSIGREVAVGEGLVGDGARLRVLLQPLQDAGVIKGVPVF